MLNVALVMTGNVLNLINYSVLNLRWEKVAWFTGHNSSKSVLFFKDKDDLWLIFIPSDLCVVYVDGGRLPALCVSGLSSVVSSPPRHWSLQPGSTPGTAQDQAVVITSGQSHWPLMDLWLRYWALVW